MPTNGNRPSGGAAHSVGNEFSNATENTSTAGPTQADSTAREPLRAARGAPAASLNRCNRPLAYAVAVFVGRPNERIHPLEALALIAKHFPGISLDVALAGFVFSKIWLQQPPPRETLQ